jgi:DNA-binding transcriptional ArsR family regulator
VETSVQSSTCVPEEWAGRNPAVPGLRARALQAEVLRALGHPVRLQVLWLLRDGEHCVCEFEPLLGLKQPNISQHLSILRGANLVATRRDGLRILYRLVDPDVGRVMDLVEDIVRRQGIERAAAVSDFSSGGADA